MKIGRFVTRILVEVTRENESVLNHKGFRFWIADLDAQIRQINRIEVSVDSRKAAQCLYLELTRTTIEKLLQRSS